VTKTPARPSDWQSLREGGYFAERDGELVLHIIGKGEKARSMPVNDELRQAVQRYVDAAGLSWDSAGPLWVPTRGRKVTHGMDPRSIRRLVQARCRQAGIRKQISTHSTRKTAGTRLLKLGVDVERVRDYLGHTSIMTTQRYLNGDGLGDNAARELTY